MHILRLLRRAPLAAGRWLFGEVWYARRLGVRVGVGCSLFRIIYGSEPWLITIGDRVQITDGVRLFTHGGGWLMRDHVPGFDSFGAIEIEDDVYIGNNALIMPGVKIGSRVLVSAGSVVTKSIPCDAVVGGNPARVLCTIQEYIARNAKYNIGTYGMSGARKRAIILSSRSKWISKPLMRRK